MDDIDAAIRCSTAAPHCGWPTAPGCAVGRAPAGLRPPRRLVDGSLRAAVATAASATPARYATTTTSRLLRALSRPLDDLQLRDLPARNLAQPRTASALDVGCGWGSFAVYAASRHRVGVTGITLSGAQALVARRRVREAGLAQHIDIRVMDYRQLAGERFDAIASIGMVEHVGAANIDPYARRLAGLLRPGGRLLNHGIARLRHGDPEAGPFSERYVFPDAAPLHLSRVIAALEGAGLETTHVEGFRHDYAETLRHWARRLDDSLEQAIKLAGPERVRVWRLYLRAARNGFETGFTSVYQTQCTRR